MGKSIMLSEENVGDINIISEFLAVSDMASNCKADLLILLGSSVIYTAESAFEGFIKGCSKELMIVGGIGHSTDYLRENIKHTKKYNNIDVAYRAEADILKDMAVKFYNINENKILIERLSTNCGDNAKKALELIEAENRRPKTIILVQDPTMQLRSYASFKHECSDKEVKFINYCPFVPKLTYNKGNVIFENKAITGLWTVERFLSLIMGEIPRLRDDENGYGPKGKNFIEHVDMPKEITSAYERIKVVLDVLTNDRRVDK